MTDPGKLYRWFTWGVVGLLGTALFRGWGWADVDRVPGVPKSVRENPGVYRSHYSSHSRWYGGK